MPELAKTHSSITDLSALKQKWPSAFVARKDVARFTGGLISPGTVANADCVQKGPEGAIRVGKNVGYPIDSFIAWLEKRVALKHDSVRARARKRREG